MADNSNHLQIEMVPHGSIHPNSKNPRRHNRKQGRQTEDSLRRFGFKGAIIVDQHTAMILAGNALWEAAGKLGMDEVPFLRASFATEADRRAFILAHNKLAEQSSWDTEIVAEELRFLFDSGSDKPLVRVNASWMELFTPYADGEGIRARFLVHLSDFTTDHSPAQGHVDEPFLEQCVTTPEDVGYFFPRGEDIFGINVRGSVSIREFLATRRVLRAIRTFNLTHMNRGRNAYQASHCYSLADHLLAG